MVGSFLVSQLDRSKHQIHILCRSPASAKKVKELDCIPVEAAISDLDALVRAVTDMDAVVHLAFNHDMMSTPEGFQDACDQDIAAIRAMGDTLAASTSGPRMLIVASGTLGNDGPDERSKKIQEPLNGRWRSEPLTLSYAQKGLKAYIVRLPPVVHTAVRVHPFIQGQIDFARRKGYAAIFEDGSQLWPACHGKDVAALFALVLDNQELPSSAVLHAVAEEGIKVGDIAQAIAQRLSVPVQQLSPDEGKEIGFAATIMQTSNRTTAKDTRTALNWSPKENTLLEDLKASDF